MPESPSIHPARRTDLLIKPHTHADGSFLSCQNGKRMPRTGAVWRSAVFTWRSIPCVAYTRLTRSVWDFDSTCPSREMVH